MDFRYVNIQGVLKKSEYLGKYKFYRKVFQTKVVGFKKIYLLILSIWSWVALSRSGQGHIFFKTLLLIPEFNSW